MQIKKVVKNLVASFITQAVNLVIHFLLPPLLVKEYSSVINGLIVTIRQLMSYVNLVGAGISIASIQSLYKPLEEKDNKTISGMFNATSVMFNKAGSVFSLIVLVLAFIYPYLVSRDLDYWLVVKLIIVSSIAGASEFFVVGRCSALLFADQKGYVISFVQAGGLIGSFILSFVLIKLHTSIVWVQLAASLVYFFRIVFLSIYVRRYYSFLDKKDLPLSVVVQKRNDALIHQFTGIGTLGSQAVILSSFVGLQAASIYAVYNVVFAGLQSIFGQITSNLTPFVGRTMVHCNMDKLREDYLVIELLFSTVVGSIIAVCSVMLFPFIGLYMKGADIEYANYTIAFLFILFACCNLYRLPAQMLINSIGHFRETRNRAIIEASLCILLQLSFVHFWGMYGVLIASIIALGWRCLDIIFYADKYILKRSIFCSLKYLFKLIIVVTIIRLSQYLTTMPRFENYWSLLLYSLLYGGVALCICFFIDMCFYQKQLQFILKFLHKKLVRK